MESRYTLPPTEERTARRAQREAARQKRKQAQRRRLLRRLLPVMALVLILAAGLTVRTVRHHAKAPETDPVQLQVKHDLPKERPAEAPPFSAVQSADTVHLGEDFPSGYAVLIDVDSGLILAEKQADTPFCPASMTKILTLLVAVEELTDLDAAVTITREITDFCYRNGCSVVGYGAGDVVSVRELLYGTILPSGADASLALALHISGSQEAFVALMNQKLEELGLSESARFTNCVGLYEQGHVCTAYDMAVILKTALENPLCREVLSTKRYTSAVPFPNYPEGQPLSNWFLRRIEDKDTGGVEVIAAKTGYVAESGSCAASYGEDKDGHGYLCVTGSAYSAWRAIYDHVALYWTYCN